MGYFNFSPRGGGGGERGPPSVIAEGAPEIFSAGGINPFAAEPSWEERPGW